MPNYLFQCNDEVFKHLALPTAFSSMKEKYAECFTALWSVFLLLCESKLQLFFRDVLQDGKGGAWSLSVIRWLCLLSVELSLVLWDILVQHYIWLCDYSI